VLGGKSVLFVGDSGAGKTTLAKLYRKHAPGAPILSDDRMAVRHRRGVFWGFGTPWHGSGRFASPEGRPLGAIFFLSHARTTRTERLGASEGASRLFARAFVPRWDGRIVGRALRVCARVAREVPCFDLRVHVGPSVIEAVAAVLPRPGRESAPRARMR
jgi:hypothetical protein